MSEPLVLKVDASELEEAGKKLDQFADQAQKAEDSADSLAGSLKKSGEASASAADGYDKLTVMQRAYLEKNQAIITAYESEYDLAVRKLRAQSQEAEGYAQLSEAQKAQIENANVLQAQAQAEANVLAALARAQENAAKATESTTQAQAKQSKTVQDVTSYWERQRQAHANWMNSSKAIDSQLTKQQQEFIELSLATQRVLDRYDPLGTKLRALQSDFARLNAEVKNGAGAGNEQAIEKAYAGLNAEMAKVKGMMDQVSGAVVGGNGKIVSSSGLAAHGMAGITRELLVLGHEAVSGNFSRIPGSLLVMANRLAAVVDIFGILLNPMTLVGIALAGVFAIMAKGSADVDHFNLVLEATNNYVGLTAGQFQQMAERVSRATTLTVGSVKELGNEMIATGKYTGDNIEEMTKLIDTFANITGQSTEEAGKYLIKLFEDPTKGAEELNQKFKQLDATELFHIQTLQEQGRAQDALTLALDLFNSKLPAHIDNLNTLDGVWDHIKKSISGAVDAMKNFSSNEGQINAVKGLLATANAINSTVFGKSGLKLIPTEGLEKNLAILEAMRASDEKDAKAKKDQADYVEAQQAGLAAINKYATESTQRAQLLAAKKAVGLVVTDDPELLAKQLEAIRKIDEAMANLGKAKPTDFSRTMEQIAKMGADAVVAYANFGKTVDEKAVPALRMLAELQNSKLWKEFTTTQKEQITNELNRVAGIQKSVAAMQEQQKVQEAIVKAQTQYGQQVAAAAKVEAQTRTAAINAAAQQALTDAKRMYDQGLIDFKTFYETQTEIQKQQLADQVANQQQALDDQEKHVKDLQDQLMHLDISQFGGDMGKYLSTAIKLSGELVKALADVGRAHQNLASAEQKAADVGQDYLEKYYIPAHKLIVDTIPALQQQIDRQIQLNETYGMTASAVQEYLAAKDEEELQRLQSIPGMEKEIALLEANIAKRKELAGVLKQGEDQKAMIDAIKSVDDEAKKLWDDMWSGGHDTFKKLGEDIKKYLLDMLYQLTVRPFLINVAAQLTGIGQPNIAGALGQSNNPLMNLLTGNNSPIGNFVTGGLSNLGTNFALSSAGTTLGLSTGATTAAVSTGGELVGGLGAGAADELVGSMTSAGTMLTDAGSTFATAAATFGSYVPYIGMAVMALSALGVFDHKPSPAKGQFQVSEGTTGFEDNAYTKGPFGLNFGFNDANTQQFSGQAAQVFNQIVTGAIGAFQSRFSAEQSTHFAQVLKQMTFDTFEGTFTTEDFLKQYGGKVLQQVVTAAFQELDPALAAVVSNFQGTADEVAQFSNTLLGIYDVTKQLNNAKFTENIDAALQGADQATADKVLAFATIVQRFGDSIEGLGPKLEKLDPANITAFVDALGGAQNAMATMQYINDNFTTSSQKLAGAQTQLDQGFAALNLKVPQTHEQFLALLNSFDLTTEAGRKLYSSVAALAPLFVEVHGTADQAAQSLSKAADAFAQIGRNALQPQADTSGFGAAQFMSSTVNDLAHATYNLRDGVQPLIHDMNVLGLGALPTTDAGWHKLIDSIDTGTEAGSKLKDTMIALYGAWLTLEAALKKGADDFHHSAMFSQSEQHAYDASQDLAAFNHAQEQLGHSFPTTVAGFRAYVLHLEDVAKGTDAAAAAARAELAILYPLVPQILDYNDALKQQSDIIVTSVGEIISATNDLKAAGVDAANKLLGSFQDLTSQSTGDFGSQLAMQIDLITKAIDKTGATLTGGGTVVTHHRGEPDVVTTQPYKYTVPGGDVQQQAYVDTLAAQNTKLTDELQRFNALTVQYGADRAKQLVELQDWLAQQKEIFKGDAAALADVQTIFQQKWNAIVSGSTAAAQSIDDFIKSLDSLVQGNYGTLGQKLAIELNAAYSKFEELTAALAKVPAGSAQATTIQSDINKISATNAQLAKYMADFGMYTAQYNVDIATQLVQLEQWRDAQDAALKAAITDPVQLANALATLDEIFNKSFQDIVTGMKNGVDGTLSELDRLKKAIADYLKSLDQSQLSALTPQQQFTEAQTTFEQTLAKAKQGDLTALGDITKYADSYLTIARDLYASSQTYIDIFNSVHDALTSLTGDSLSNTTNDALNTASTSGSATQSASAPSPTTTAQQTSTTSALEGALPLNGARLVSAQDLSDAADKMIAAINTAVGELMKSNNAAISDASGEVVSELRRVEDAVTATAK